MADGSFAIVVATNDAACLNQNLLASPDVWAGHVSVNVQEGAVSASAAYNAGLAETSAEFVIFAHQDVYFPAGWFTALAAQIEAVAAIDPHWGIIAPFGMTADGQHIGQVWSTSLGRVVGQELKAPVAIQSMDELVIVLRRASGVTFDEALPGYHMYGTDIVQTSIALGHGAFACQLPLVHNDNFHGRLGSDFTESYNFVRRKWRDALPIRTPVVWVTPSGFALRWYRLKAWRSYAKRKAMALDVSVDPHIYAARCGREDVAV